jgi:signal peptidase II
MRALSSRSDGGPVFMKLLIWAVPVCLIDQLTKLVIVRNFTFGETKEILPFFHLTLVYNTGTAFGLFKGVNVFFIIISCVIIFLLVWWQRVLVGHRIITAIGYVLIMGGAWGNLIDRVVYGHVIDFLDFLVWPVFNVADSAICVGTALLVLFHRAKQPVTGG